MTIGTIEFTFLKCNCTETNIILQNVLSMSEPKVKFLSRWLKKTFS